MIITQESNNHLNFIMEKKKKDLKLNTIFNWKEIIRIVITFILGFFYAVIDLVWALAGFFLLAGLLVYFKTDYTSVQPFFYFIELITNYWGYFFTVLWAYKSYIVYNNIEER
jgi:hypothetical protein